MASYGTSAAVEILVYGAVNTDEDTRCDQARTTATAIINAFLNVTQDINSPSAQITQAANLIAAAILTTTPEGLTTNAWWQQGVILLELSRGDSETDASWGYNIPVLKD